MGKTGTKSPNTIPTVVIAALLIVSAAAMGFRQLYREGIFSETQPIKLTQEPSQTQPPPRMQPTPRTQQSGQTPPAPGTPYPRQMPSTPPMQPPTQSQSSAQTQPPPQMPPSSQTPSNEAKAPAATEAPKDPVEDDAAFQMWLEQEMQATEYDKAMEEIVAEDANTPQETPAPTEQNEPNTSR